MTNLRQQTIFYTRNKTGIDIKMTMHPNITGGNQNSTFEEETTKSAGIAILSIFLLILTMILGIILNISGLVKLRKKPKNNLSLIQLLTTALTVCAISVPLQISRIILGFMDNDFIVLCEVHHFIHLHTDSCTFVTLMVITFERLQKINKSSLLASGFSYKKCLLQSSWMIVLPLVIAIIYIDSQEPSKISIFTRDCAYNPNSASVLIVEYSYISMFLVTLLTMATMYSFAIYRLRQHMECPSRSIYPTISNVPAHSTTTLGRLEPREATYSIPAESRMDFTVNTISKNHHSLTNVYRLPSVDTDSENAVSLEGDKSVEMTPTNEPCELSAEHLVHLRKLSETIEHQSREKSKSSIANALGQISNISLFSLDSEMEQRCDAARLSPLKHTRRSAGNVWHDSEMTTLKRPPSIKIRKKQKMLPKLKKQNSIDSIGTFSDGSCTWTDRTDSDISSITMLTEGSIPIFDDSCSAISVIVEQPEHELSRHPSIDETQGRKISLDRDDTRQTINGLLAPGKDGVRTAPLLLEPGTSCQQYEQEEFFRPRSYSASFNVDNTDDNSQHDDSFRKRAFTDSSKTKPKQLPNKNKIRSFRRKMRRKKKNKGSLLTPSAQNQGNHRFSSDSGSDTSHETPDSNMKSPSTSQNDEHSSLMSDVIEWSDSSSQDTFQSGSSKQTYYSQQRRSKFRNTTTQTEVFSSIMVETDQHIEHVDKEKSPIVKKRNNWFPEESDGRTSRGQSRLTINNNMVDRSAHNSPNRRSKPNTKQTIQRTLLIIVSFAMSYIPTCAAVALVNVISMGHTLSLLLIARSLQYCYFALIPIIYVFTNQGLQKTLVRPNGARK